MDWLASGLSTPRLFRKSLTAPYTILFVLPGEGEEEEEFIQNRTRVGAREEEEEEEFT